jgi:hypothetical protein
MMLFQDGSQHEWLAVQPARSDPGVEPGNHLGGCH